MADDWERDRERVARIARDVGFPPSDAEVLAREARPAARLFARPGGSIRASGSKLGGLPDLAPGTSWPTGRHGPMTFLGQVDTDDARFLAGVDGWPPERVLLSFFVDKDPASDEVEPGTGSGIVLAADPGTTASAEAPAGLHPRSRLPEALFHVRRAMTPPMAIDTISGIDLEHDLDADDWRAWDRLYEGLGCGEASRTAGHHQLLGRPWLCGDMDPVWMGGVLLADDGELDEPAHPFRLLAAFTTDLPAGVEFADAGGIYFVGRADDLAAHRFHRLAVVMQTS